MSVQFSERTLSAGASTSDTEYPTLQFAESVRSFVSKCQTLCITSEEYRLMKLIALFQSAGLFVLLLVCFY